MDWNQLKNVNVRYATIIKFEWRTCTPYVPRSQSNFPHHGNSPTFPWLCASSLTILQISIWVKLVQTTTKSKIAKNLFTLRQKSRPYADQNTDTSKFHLARHVTSHNSTRSTCRAHAFLMCRACQTARLDTLITTRSTRRTCRVVLWRDERSVIWAYLTLQKAGKQRQKFLIEKVVTATADRPKQRTEEQKVVKWLFGCASQLHRTVHNGVQMRLDKSDTNNWLLIRQYSVMFQHQQQCQCQSMSMSIYVNREFM